MKGTLRTRLRRSLDTTFALHVAETLVAGVPATLVARALERSIGGSASEASRRGTLFEGLNAFAHGPQAPRLLVGCAIAIFGYAALSPLLAMAWNVALVDGVPFRRSASRAPRLYLPSMLGRLLAFGTTLPFAAVALALPAVAHLALSHHPDVPTHDLVVLLAALPIVAVALLGATFADLLELALVVDGPRVLEAWLLGLRALSPRVLTLSLAARALRLLVSVVAIATVSVAGDGLVSSTLALGAAQAVLLGGRFVRAAWLARAAAHLESVR